MTEIKDITQSFNEFEVAFAWKSTNNKVVATYTAKVMGERGEIKDATEAIWINVFKHCRWDTFDDSTGERVSTKISFEPKDILPRILLEVQSLLQTQREVPKAVLGGGLVVYIENPL